MNKKHKKNCTTLSYIEDLPVLASMVTERLSISAFASLVGNSIDITSSAVELKN